MPQTLLLSTGLVLAWVGLQLHHMDQAVPGGMGLLLEWMCANATQHSPGGGLRDQSVGVGMSEMTMKPKASQSGMAGSGRQQCLLQEPKGCFITAVQRAAAGRWRQ